MKTAAAALIRSKDQILICKSQNNSDVWMFPSTDIQNPQNIQQELTHFLSCSLHISPANLLEIGSVLQNDVKTHFYLCSLPGKKALEAKGELSYLQDYLKGEGSIRFVDKVQIEHLDLCPVDAGFLEKNMEQAFEKSRRLFIALPFSKEIVEDLLTIQQDWKKEGCSGRWIPADNFHITLAFIGSTFASSQIQQILDEIQAEPFTLKLSKAGHFQDLWYTGFENNPALQQYAARLKSALIQKGIPLDRKPLKLHVTLLRSGKVPEGFAPDISPVTFMENRVVLYESVFTDTGVVYKPLKTINL